MLFITLLFKETTDYLYNSKTENIDVNSLAENFTVGFLIPHGYCKTFTMQQTDTLIMVKFETGVQDGMEGHGESYFVFIYDINLSTQFQVPYHFITGDNIIMETTNVAQYREYTIQLKETKVETKNKILKREKWFWPFLLSLFCNLINNFLGQLTL